MAKKKMQEPTQEEIAQRAWEIWGRSQDALLTMLAEFARKTDGAEPARERAVNPQEQLFSYRLTSSSALVKSAPPSRRPTNISSIFRLDFII